MRISPVAALEAIRAAVRNVYNSLVSNKP